METLDQLNRYYPEISGNSGSWQRQDEPEYKAVQELIVVDDMHTRKAMMYKGTDAFIVLPGGLGTLDEMMEVLTWNQLGIINAPVHILNISGYWDHVVGMLHHATEEGFVHSKGLLHFSVADNADDLVDNLERQMADRSS